MTIVVFLDAFERYEYELQATYQVLKKTQIRISVIEYSDVL